MRDRSPANRPDEPGSETVSVERLQAYLRYHARQQHDTVAVPPFTLFCDPRNPLVYFNYAMPDRPLGGDLRTELAGLRASFAKRWRQPRLEFIEAYAPELALALRAAGFVEESRLWLMVCTPRSFRPAPAIPGLTLTILSAISPPEQIRDWLNTQRLGFAMDEPVPAPDADVALFRQNVGGSRAFLARLGGQPVGAGVFTAPQDKLSEIAGIATLLAYRRRGIASALTAHAVQAAFAQGVECAFLTAAAERAGRVYERIGFRPYATVLTYTDPS